MALKVWNGSSWVTATGLKVWNGSSWVASTAGKIWNGSAWTTFFTSATVAIADLTLTSSVGATFNGVAGCSLQFFATDGTLFYSLGAYNTGAGAYNQIEYSGGVIIDSNAGGSLMGNVPGMWKLSGSASDYEIYVSASGALCAITNASFNTWTNMSNNVAISVDTAINDAIDQTFTVQIRSASTLVVLDTATIVMNALAAGIN
jgi:hypothetical protein